MSIHKYRGADNPTRHQTESVRDLLMKRVQIDTELREILGDDFDAILDPIRGMPVLLQEAQNYLWNREKQLILAEQLVHLGCWSWEIQHDKMIWSEGLYRLHGIPYQEGHFNFSRSLNQVHPDDYEYVRRTYDDAVYNKGPFSIQYRIIQANGEIRYLLNRAKVFTNQAGIPIKMIGACLDISENVKAEAERTSLVEDLRKTEKDLRDQNKVLEDNKVQLFQERQRYVDLFEFAPDGYLVSDEMGRILEANKAAASLLDTPQDLLAGKLLIDFILPEDRRNFQTMVDQLKRDEKVIGWESALKSQGGVSFPVVMIVASQRDSWGIPLSLRWQLHDISERKFASESLRASQQKLNSIVTGAPLLLWAVDLEKKITYFEGKSLSAMKLNSQEFIGHPIIKFFENSPQVLEDIETALKGDEVASTVDVRGHIMETRYSPLKDAKKDITGVIGVSIDITAQKQLEADLAELNRRLVQGRENDRLILSQEIHDGPVQDMYGILFHLRAFADNLPSGVSREPIKQLQENLQRVIDTLRTISGELRPPTLAPFGLEKAIRSHAYLFQQANPHLILELNLMSDSQELPELVRLTLFRIYQQALSNVGRHANAKNILVHLEFSDNEVNLAIQDDGNGFELPEKWIAFARESRLGLIDAIERAQSVGGQLLIESSHGQGTILRAVIPR